MSTSPQISVPFPHLAYARVLVQQRFYRFGHKQLIIDSFKHFALIVITDDTRDLLVHCLKPDQPGVRGWPRLAKGVIL